MEAIGGALLPPLCRLADTEEDDSGGVCSLAAIWQRHYVVVETLVSIFRQTTGQIVDIGTLM